MSSIHRTGDANRDDAPVGSGLGSGAQLPLSVIRRRLWAYALGALLVVVGDALYGLGYYERLVVEPWVYVASAMLGVIAGGLYIYGGIGVACVLDRPRSRRLVGSSLGVFGFTLAVVHAFAGALMIVENEHLRYAEGQTFDAVLDALERGYEVLALPMFAALIVGYGWSAVDIGRGRALVPRWTAVVSPLVLASVQQLFVSSLWFPLRSAALVGGAWFVLLAVTLERSPRERP